MSYFFPRAKGFSLIEIAVVLAILSVLLAIVAAPLAGQIEQRRTEETQKILESSREAVIGFAISNGRLPCPASATSAGVEAFNTGASGTATNGICASYSGFLPAVTLGINPVDAGGYALDAWGTSANRIRYAVVDLSVPASPAFSNCTNSAMLSHVLTANGVASSMRTATMACLAETGLTMLTICGVTPTGPAGAATGCTNTLTNKAPFVVFSFGKNAPVGGVGTDEAHNVDADTYLVSHTKTAAGSPSGEFDDIVVWGSLNILFARMVQAGRLP